MLQERQAEFRSEFYNGAVFAMAGGSRAHATICMNIGSELRNTLKGRGCRVASSDMRVRVGTARLYTYPDVVVWCGEPEMADTDDETLINPALVVEVLSPSTEAHDRGFKTAQYRSVKSIREYALVWQSEACVEVYTRQSEGWLLSEFTGLKASCRFPGMVCEVAMSEIYLGVDLPADPAFA